MKDIITHSVYDERFCEYVREADQLPEDCIFLEVGTSDGKSAVSIIDNCQKDRWLFTVDPYGNKPYYINDAINTEHQWDEESYQTAMFNLVNFAVNHKKKHCHWRMTSFDFMDNIEKIKFYQNGSTIDYKFGFVYLDGEHSEGTCFKEFNWFKERLVPGGIIIIDDYNYWDKTRHLFDEKDFTVWEPWENKKRLVYKK